MTLMNLRLLPARAGVMTPGRSANGEGYIRSARVATRKPANLTARDIESATHETHNLQEKFEKYGHMDFKRLLNRIGGIPARVLMRVMARQYPQKEYGGLRLVVPDDRLAPSAERFFSWTKEALATAAARAPQAYAKFRKDIHQVLLWDKAQEAPYHKFLLAAVVPPQMALEADTLCYATWLLYVSGLSVNKVEAQARSEEFLASLEHDEGTRVAAWLTSATEHESR
jgi:hypothetical protein